MLLEQSCQRVLHADDGLVLDLDVFRRRLARLRWCCFVLEQDFGRLSLGLGFEDDVAGGLRREAADDVEEGELELGVWLALLHQKLVGLVAQRLIVRQGVDERCLNLCYCLLHICSLFEIYSF